MKFHNVIDFISFFITKDTSRVADLRVRVLAKFLPIEICFINIYKSSFSITAAIIVLL